MTMLKLADCDCCLLQPCSKAPAPVIRLGDIAKRLPLPIRNAVADALVYDPPSPSSQPGPPAENSSLQQTSSTSAQAEGTSMQQPCSISQPHSGNPPVPVITDSTSAPAHKHSMSGASLCPAQRLDQAAQGGVRRLALPASKHAEQAKHGHAAGLALAAWRNPALMTPREVALEQLLTAKLSQPVLRQQDTFVTEAEPSQHVPGHQVSVSAGAARGSCDVRSAQSERGSLRMKPMSAQAAPAVAPVPSLSLAAVMQHAQKDAEIGRQQCDDNTQ